MNSLAKLIKILNSETEPGQIALGFCFALVMGLTPLFSMHNIAVLFCVLLLRVNLSAFLVSFALFTSVAYAVDPVSNRIGLAVLTTPMLEGLWTALYNTALGRLGQFNNTVMMGSVLLSLALFVPLYFLSTHLIRQYRENILEAVRRTRLMQGLKASKLYDAYSKVSGWTS